jgi:hypothetical protein
MSALEKENQEINTLITKKFFHGFDRTRYNEFIADSKNYRTKTIHQPIAWYNGKQIKSIKETKQDIPVLNWMKNQDNHIYVLYQGIWFDVDSKKPQNLSSTTSVPALSIYTPYPELFVRDESQLVKIIKTGDKDQYPLFFV